MTTRNKHLLSAVIVIVLMFVFVYTAVWGIGIGDLYIPSVFDQRYNDGIILGLDLQGGVALVFEAEVDEGYSSEEIQSGMSTIVKVLQQRADAKGFTEATVAKSGEKKVRVEIPAISSPDEAVEYLGSTGELKFVDAEGTVILTGKDVVAAKSGLQESSSGIMENVVELEFNSDAQKAWADATLRVAGWANEKDSEGNAKNYIKIMVDEEQISKASVAEQIDSNKCVISGSFTARQAADLANQISFGKLPFKLKVVQSTAVGPLLGEKALQTSLVAGLIGVILVMCFMMIMYRLPGVVATLALVFYIGLMGVMLVLFRVNLSLPGIAGIILSIGMAVDANVVIFERVKEEMRNRKTIRASIESGFKSAFRAILDSNITTIIAALVLMIMGTGTIKSFAITLLIGVVISMITALVVTKVLLNSLIELRVVNPWLYGVKRGALENEKV